MFAVKVILVFVASGILGHVVGVGLIHIILDDTPTQTYEQGVNDTLDRFHKECEEFTTLQFPDDNRLYACGLVPAFNSNSTEKIHEI